MLNSIAGEKILLVQLYSNGDCLYATAVARQIKLDYPGCHLIWAIAPFCKSIIANNPFVDEILEIDSVKKNDVAAFRRLKKEIYYDQQKGKYNKVFIVHNIDTNHAYYDGSIRSSILKAYNSAITVPVQPVLRLFPWETENAAKFIKQFEIEKFKNVVLFEYAPQSGQSKMTSTLALEIAEQIAASGDTAVILSSPNKIVHHNKAIIDGSYLSLRETAALSHFCTFLLGSSSGITWITTSEAGKQLPMVQLLNPYTAWVNSISRDFERFNIPNHAVIELFDFNSDIIVDCVKTALRDFEAAKEKYGTPVPLHFKTTRKIVYNLLCYFEFTAILKHVKINREVYGDNISFYKELVLGFIMAPFTLVKNIYSKLLADKYLLAKKKLL